MGAAREKARQLAREHLEQGRFTDWFEALYASAGGNAGAIPWAELTVNPNFTEWLGDRKLDGRGKKALVIACGLGDDAEKLGEIGFAVTAFDISPTAIAWCRRRFPESTVEYVVADLFDAPAAWDAAFDFVLECYTIQSFPPELQARVIERIARFMAPGGTLLVICRGREPDEQKEGPPWPLTKNTLDAFCALGLDEVAFDDYVENEEPPVRRFRVEYAAGTS